MKTSVKVDIALDHNIYHLNKVEFPVSRLFDCNFIANQKNTSFYQISNSKILLKKRNARASRKVNLD